MGDAVVPTGKALPEHGVRSYRLPFEWVPVGMKARRIAHRTPLNPTFRVLTPPPDREGTM